MPSFTSPVLRSLPPWPPVSFHVSSREELEKQMASGAIGGRLTVVSLQSKPLFKECIEVISKSKTWWTCPRSHAETFQALVQRL